MASGSSPLIPTIGEKSKNGMSRAALPTMPCPAMRPPPTAKSACPAFGTTKATVWKPRRCRHNFVGKGWYRRQVEIPKAWQGQRVFLIVTGALRYAKVWVNEKYLGEHIGFLSPFEFDLTDHVAPGSKATITIQVDSSSAGKSIRCSAPARWPTTWTSPGAAFGATCVLEARPDVWLSDLFVRPYVSSSRCLAYGTINGRAALTDAGKLEIFDCGGQQAENGIKLEAGFTEIIAENGIKLDAIEVGSGQVRPVCGAALCKAVDTR